MAPDQLQEELRRLQDLVTRLSAEVGEKNQELEFKDKVLEERTTFLSMMTEERDHIYQLYNEEKRKTERIVYENEMLMRELVTQRKEIKLQGKEIEKLEAQLDFKSNQLLVLSEEVTRKRNINMSSGDNVQLQLDLNSFRKELDEKDYESDSEPNLNQTLIGKEHRSNHDLHEMHKVLIEEVKREDHEKLTKPMVEWGEEDFEGSGGEECNDFQDMFPPIPPPESFDMSNNSPDLSSDLPVPDDENAEFQWLSTFVEDSLSDGGITLDIDLCKNSKKDDSCRLRTSNPGAILKNSSSCPGRKPMLPSPGTVVPGRVRSKRPRPASFNQRPALNLVSPTSCITNAQDGSYLLSESENFAESHLPYTPKFNGKEQKKKKKKRKRLPPSVLSDHATRLQQQQQPGGAVKKCSHCEITKTPQWREGPLGPSTLCNACGVCYKRGRLLPEYRPATSPTFVPSLHSNTHKKVLAMRIEGTPGDTNPTNSAPEFLPARNTHLLESSQVGARKTETEVPSSI
ncbi:hypothetical protein MKX03_036644 [Papaver bracteatum]|nr:hypothetical protein MKX03_036644 [Papaver bracteatum]